MDDGWMDGPKTVTVDMGSFGAESDGYRRSQSVECGELDDEAVHPPT